MSVPSDRPAYRILAVYGFYGPDDVMYNEGDCIVYDGEPNEEMEPLNELARVKLTEYLEKLDNLAKLAAEKAGRPFVGRPRTIDGALVLAEQIQRQQMAIMSAKKVTNDIERVDPDPIPEVGNANPKKKPGRPAYKNISV